MKGWIPLWRKFFERDDWLAPSEENPACRGYAWLDLCQLAQRRTYEHAGERLGKGEVLVSIRLLARRWSWHRSRVERLLRRLKAETMIETVRETPRGTVYRIVKYSAYAIEQGGERDTLRDTPRDTSETITTMNNDEVRSFYPKPEESRSEVDLPIEPEDRELSREIGSLVQRVGSTWNISEGIDSWARRLRRNAKYAGLDLVDEVRRCAEWHEQVGKTPRAPGSSIHTWLRKACDRQSSSNVAQVGLNLPLRPASYYRNHR